jgi:ribosome-associated protein
MACARAGQSIDRREKRSSKYVQSSEFKQLAEDALDDLKATDIVALDVTGFTSITDYMLIASGRSDRHVRSIADSVIDKAKEVGQPVLGVEGHEYGEWVLVDLGDVVVHVMQPRARDFYKLEDLWGMDDKSGRPTDAEQAG